MIKWGDKYKEWSDKKKIDYLEKGWSSSNEALDKMQTERNELLETVGELRRLLVNADKAYQTQKMINTASITESNAQTQRDAEEIRLLRVRVKAQDKVLHGNNH